MKQGCAILVLGLTMAFAGSTTAAEDGTSSTTGDAPALALADCLRIGLENATVLRNAVRDQGIADERIRQVRAQALPHVDLAAGYTRIGEIESVALGEGDAVELGKEDNYSASARLSQLLYSGGSVASALNAAEVYRDMADVSRTQAEAQLRRDIPGAFYDVLLARSAVRVREESVRQLEQLLAQSEVRHRAGAAAEFEVLSARSRLANGQPALIDAQRNLALARLALRNLLRATNAVDAAGELVYEPLEVDEEALVRRGLAHRTELRYLALQADLRRADVEASLAGYRPSFSAWAGYEGNNPASAFETSDEWDWGWSAGLEGRWSLVDGGLTRGAVHEKRLTVDKTLAELDQARLAVELEIRGACLSLRHAARSVTAAEESTALATKALEIAAARHREGLATQLDYADASLALEQARLALCGAIRDHRVERVRLAYAAGMTEDELEGGRER